MIYLYVWIVRLENLTLQISLIFLPQAIAQMIFYVLKIPSFKDANESSRVLF